MAIEFYPAIIERAGDGFSVYFPDVPGCTSAGRTLNEAVLNAEQALSGHIVELDRYGDPIPAASDLANLAPQDDDDIVICILVRVELPGKAVRVNITLDEGLIAAIDRVANNRSGFLAEAAREKLAHQRELEGAA